MVDFVLGAGFQCPHCGEQDHDIAPGKRELYLRCLGCGTTWEFRPQVGDVVTIRFDNHHNIHKTDLMRGTVTSVYGGLGWDQKVDWYLELDTDFGYRYWKQGPDGGDLVTIKREVD